MDDSVVTKFEDFVSRFVYKSVPVEGLFSQPRLISKGPIGKSLGERLVKDILENDLQLVHGIDYLTEHVFENMDRRLRFDFYIKRSRLLIEFDGDQHYTGSRFHRTRAEWVDAIQRDEIKNSYCQKHGYSLIRIPQVYTRHRDKLRDLILRFVERVDKSDGPLLELDLYFQIKSGKIVL